MDQKDLNGKYLLIENCPGIGDLIMCTPALRRLKEIFPHCILTIVSYENNLPIVSRLPYVDYVCGIKKGGGWEDTSTPLRTFCNKIIVALQHINRY